MDKRTILKATLFNKKELEEAEKLRKEINEHLGVSLGFAAFTRYLIKKCSQKDITQL